MRKRLPVATAVFAVLVVSVFAILWSITSHDSISRAACADIHEGMALQEVEVLLGGPEGVYTSDGEDWSVGMLHNGLIQLGHTRRVWVGNDGGIRIDFDEQGNVANRQWCPKHTNLWDRIRGWLHVG